MLIESLLDSLKFLDYSKLSILQQVNRQFFVFIKRYRNELALKEFSQIEIIADNDVRLSVYRRAVDVVNEVEEQFGSEIYDFELNEDQREKWIDALENHIPLYLSEAILEMSQANDVDSFLIFITRKGIQFQSNSVWLNTGSFITENQEEHQHTLKFVEKYLNIYCKLHLRVHAYFDGLLHFLLNFGGKVEQVVFHYGPGHLNVELHNLLVYHAEMSKNCLKIIPKICFENADDFPWPDLCTKTKIIEEGNVEDGLYLTKYKILNYYSSSVYFLIKIFHLFGAGEFKRFEIERINI
uniref:F-box domain-containing protein n=1 Tax=Meloidogyne hapla TaxID=6305 RepID=A0A1I8BR97_MELHA